MPEASPRQDEVSEEGRSRKLIAAETAGIVKWFEWEGKPQRLLVMVWSLVFAIPWGLICVFPVAMGMASSIGCVGLVLVFLAGPVVVYYMELADRRWRALREAERGFDRRFPPGSRDRAVAEEILSEQKEDATLEWQQLRRAILLKKLRRRN